MINDERRITRAHWQNELLVLSKTCMSCDATTKLSKQETLIYNYIVAGYTVHSIAKIINRSPKTVSTYKYRILDKLAIDSETHSRDIGVLLLHHWIRERAIILKELVAAGKEDLSPEFIAGYVAATVEITMPDIRMITGRVGILSERNALDDLNPKEALK